MDDLTPKDNYEFLTKKYRIDYFNNVRCSKKINIYPKDSKWDFTKLAIFLNEYTFLNTAHTGFSKNDDIINPELKFHFVYGDNDFFIKITNNEITVKVSTSFIIATWVHNMYDHLSNIGAQDKTKNSIDFNRHVVFSKSLYISDSSKALNKEFPLFFFNKNNFSHPFQYFVTRLVKNGLPINNDTEIFHNFTNFFDEKKNSKINSIRDLIDEGMKGHLRLKLQLARIPKRLELFIYQGIQYYIVAGVFVFPQAKHFLVQHKEITKGYILDTTWRVMPLYVTSILTVSFLNTSLPIGFSFSHTENKASYQYLLDTVSRELEIDFEENVILSDQGKSLIGLCKDNNIIHLTCLRHFLNNLKKFNYAYEVGEIIQSKSVNDLRNALENFSKKFTQIVSNYPLELNLINKALKKIGMKFENNEIITENIQKFNEVSMHTRVLYQMPSTSNSLEATHGHLNRGLPRNHQFWRSIYRLYEELSAKYPATNERIVHNYSYLKNKITKKMNKTNKDEMQKQISFYKTSQNYCECSENLLESANFLLDIPCSHRLFLGEEFPSLPEFTMITDLQYDQLQIEIDIEQTVEIPHNSEYFYLEKEYSFRTIKRFSKSKKDDEIRSYVDQKYKNFDERDGYYINGREISLIQLIEDGILLFKKKGNQ